ncbi:MAG: rRNA maturation RNase YbeY [Clostridiales bacterium]|jgi:probable rRNA maturation factor|nr:rRNA maturation RNase YbeY [Clostridiales bacterium]
MGIVVDQMRPDIDVSEKIKAAALMTAVRALEREGFSAAEADITFADDAEIQKFNKKFRRVDAPTDVLSFPMFEAYPPKRDVFLGDVIISVDAVKRQARDFGHSEEREAGFLAAHGVLHLMGYDHADADGEKIMTAAQEAILMAVGLLREKP